MAIAEAQRSWSGAVRSIPGPAVGIARTDVCSRSSRVGLTSEVSTSRRQVGQACDRVFR